MWYWLQEMGTSAVIWGLDWAGISKRAQSMLAVCCQLNWDWASTCMCGLCIWLWMCQHGSRILRGSISRASALRDSGNSHRNFYDVASEIWELLATLYMWGQVTKASTDSRGGKLVPLFSVRGSMHNEKGMNQAWPSLTTHVDIIIFLILEMRRWRGWQVNFIVLMQHPELKLGNLLPESILLVTTYYCLTCSNSIHEGNDNKGYNDILCFCLGY